MEVTKLHSSIIHKCCKFNTYKIHFYFGKESIMLGLLSMFGLHILGLLIWKYYLQVEWLNNECWNGKVTKNIKSWEIFLTVGCLKLNSLRVFQLKVYLLYPRGLLLEWTEVSIYHIINVPLGDGLVHKHILHKVCDVVKLELAKYYKDSEMTASISERSRNSK